MNELHTVNETTDQEELDWTQKQDLEAESNVAFENDDMEESEEEQDLPNVDLSDFCSAQSTTSTRAVGEAGLITIVNSSKNGKRITLSHSILNHLNNPNSVEFSFTTNEIAIAEDLPSNGHKFPLKQSGRKGIIYSYGLVQEITEKFNFDFTDKVSITLHKGQFVKFNNLPVVIIKVTE